MRIRLHIDTLDVIMENYCGKLDKKGTKFRSLVPQNNGPTHLG